MFVHNDKKKNPKNLLTSTGIYDIIITERKERGNKNDNPEKNQRRNAYRGNQNVRF